MTDWIDTYDGNEIFMRTMVRDDYLVTVYEPTNRYDGTEGELYHLREDPHQWRNLWDDPGHASLKTDLVADMRDHLPEGRTEPLEKIAPV